MEWEEPHDSALYCIKTDKNHMIASGSSYYGVVRLWDKRQTRCLQVTVTVLAACLFIFVYFFSYLQYLVGRCSSWHPPPAARFTVCALIPLTCTLLWPPSSIHLTFELWSNRTFARTLTSELSWDEKALVLPFKWSVQLITRISPGGYFPLVCSVAGSCECAGFTTFCGPSLNGLNTLPATSGMSKTNTAQICQRPLMGFMLNHSSYDNR